MAQHRLTDLQKQIVAAVTGYLASWQTSSPPLVLIKYRKRMPVFRLSTNGDDRQSCLCSFYRTESSEWILHDRRDELDRVTPLWRYDIRYGMEPLLARPGVSTALFHALNRLSCPARRVELRYNTQREAREAHEYWVRESYNADVTGLAVTSAAVRRTERQLYSLALHYAHQPKTQLDWLRVYEDCDVDRVCSGVLTSEGSAAIYIVCLDTRNRREEQKRLLELEQAGQACLFWCESEPMGCMDYAECDELLTLLRRSDAPLEEALALVELGQEQTPVQAPTDSTTWWLTAGPF